MKLLKLLKHLSSYLHVFQPSFSPTLSLSLSPPCPIPTPYMSFQPTSATSKVILDLQSTIDSLRAELAESKVTLNETKQKYSILSKRNETMVEQLSNSKHQAEVAESLLKRKERRVIDLESQLTEVSSNNDNYRFELENLKSKLLVTDNEKFRLISENERISKSYEILQSSFNEYKLSINHQLETLKFQIPDFINKTTTNLSTNLNTLKLNQPEINSSYNLLLKNSKRLEELYNQKYDKVNNYLLLLTESTKQHGEATSIVMDECEEILKKLNRNEDVLLKIKNETTGNLTDLDKMKELSKRRDLSILNLTQQQSQSPTPTTTPTTTTTTTSTPSTPTTKKIDSPILIKSDTFDRKRNASSSPSILDFKFNTSNNSRNSSPDVEIPTNRSNKRNSLNVQKRENFTNNNSNNNRRKRNSYRHSMNQDDLKNLASSPNQPNSRIPSDFLPQQQQQENSMSRSNSTRKNNYRNSRNFSNNSIGNNNNNNNNRKFSIQSQHAED